MKKAKLEWDFFILKYNPPRSSGCMFSTQTFATKNRKSKPPGEGKTEEKTKTEEREVEERDMVGPIRTELVGGARDWRIKWWNQVIDGQVGQGAFSK